MTAFDGHIHFFDIKSKLPGKHQSWSPNTLKIRMTLNYKRIPYVESFISYPDIQPFCDHHGIPNDTVGNDPPRATLPAILHYDGRGELVKAMGNSIDIARYLDAICPSRPVILAPRPVREVGWGNGVEAYLASFKAVLNPCWAAGYHIVVPTIPAILDDRAAEWFIADRKEDHEEKKSPLEWGAADPEDDWKALVPALQRLTRSMAHTTEGEPFLLGGKPCYVDFALAGYLVWYERGSGENFARIIKETGGEGAAVGRFYRACQGWIEGQGEVREWKVGVDSGM